MAFGTQIDVDKDRLSKIENDVGKANTERLKAEMIKYGQIPKGEVELMDRPTLAKKCNRNAEIRFRRR